MWWSVRLRRHGGLKALMAKRTAQAQRIARLSRVSRDEMLPAAMAFLQGHPMRVLGAQVEAYLDQLEPKAPEPD
jgi:phosphoserine phosphatase